MVLGAPEVAPVVPAGQPVKGAEVLVVPSDAPASVRPEVARVGREVLVGGEGPPSGVLAGAAGTWRSWSRRS